MGKAPRVVRLAEINIWRNRAPKQVGGFKCCYVCGAPGGNEATRTLILAGYRVKPQTIAFAHEACLLTATREHLEFIKYTIQLERSK